MSFDENFFYSQHALNIFKMCPIRFKKRYIEGLYWKRAQSEDESIEKGKNFHILAERYFSDVPLKMEFFEEYGELNEWMDALEEHIPQRPQEEYYPEYQIKIDDDGMKLQAKYDLVYIDGEGTITIYDWKTQKRPINYRDIENSMQTRVYRYVMALGGDRLKGEDVAPEDIVMKYWQPKFPSQSVELSYSRRRFEKDREFLRNLLYTIEEFDYESYDKAKSKKYCKKCEFNYFCNTDKVEYSSIFLEEDIELDDWDDIEDIHF